MDGILLPTPPFQHCHRLIQDCGQNTEDHDGHDHEIQLKDLAAVDDEEAKACLGGEKLADDDADEAETDVDLHVADDKWNRAGQQDLCEDILLFFLPACRSDGSGQDPWRESRCRALRSSQIPPQRPPP